MTWALRAKPGSLEAAARAGFLVLDIDGVLLDPAPSFYAAARETSSRAATRALERDPGPAVTDAEIAVFKAIGGWNDDFELAAGCAWALVARETIDDHPPVEDTARRSAVRGLPALLDDLEARLDAEALASARIHCDPKVIRDRCAARYAGGARCRRMYGLDPHAFEDLPDDGLWLTETLLATPVLLRASGFELGIFTGRTPAESALAIERFSLEVKAEHRLEDDGETPRKPRPEGLVRLARTARPPGFVFVGDTIDDQRAALAYREIATREDLAPIVFVRALGPAATPTAIQAALDTGADVVTPGLDELLRAIPPRDRRDDR